VAVKLVRLRELAGPSRSSAHPARVGSFLTRKLGVEQGEDVGPWPQELKESDLVEPEEADAGEEVLPSWAKIAIGAILGLLGLLLIGGGAAAPAQPWLAQAAPASSAYFSAGSASVGVVSCSSGLGLGFFSIGLISVGAVGSIGIFSVGFFSIGFFSIGVFSMGHFAIGIWAWGVYSRWVQRGRMFEGGGKVSLSLTAFNGVMTKAEPAAGRDATSMHAKKEIIY
jgi:hypothetical protein